MSTTSKVFEAEYTSRCGNGDAIEPGQAVRFVDDVLMHVTCPDDPEAVAGIGAAVRPVCAKCSQELPVTLVCGWCE